MSGSFDDVTLTWRGKDYPVPANRMMGAIARIEDHLTLPELGRFGDRATLPMAKVSAAFASVLVYAGAKATAEEVYEAMFSGGEQQNAIAASIVTLLSMMVPKSARDKFTADADDASGNLLTAGTNSSRKRTSSRAAGRKRSGGVRRKNSGN
jgi:hypothetical protein